MNYVLFLEIKKFVIPKKMFPSEIFASAFCSSLGIWCTAFDCIMQQFAERHVFLKHKFSVCD